MTRVGVFGACGRMGAEVCRAVDADAALQLVAAVDPAGDGEALSKVAGIASELIVSGKPEALLEADAHVAVDFTVAEAAFSNIKWCLGNGIHAVVGTTGLTSEQLEEIREAASSAESNVFIAPNFAIGAVLMMELARRAARFLPEAEIVELHHDQKKDAPSGTALRTAEGIAEARRETPSTRKESELLAGARGGEKDAVRIHSVRLPGLVAHQEVIFGGPGQTLTIRHDSTDRTSFMPGVLMAVKAVSKLEGLTVGLEKLLTDESDQPVD